MIDSDLLKVLGRLQARIKTLESERAAAPRWATVTSGAPLQVRLDGEAAALAATPDTLVGGLADGDRVRVVIEARAAIVTGKAGGATATPEATAATPNTLALRDANARMKAAPGVAADDVATVGQTLVHIESTLLNSALAATYAEGITLSTTGSGNGWPESWSSVVTYKLGGYVTQVLYRKDGPETHHRRRQNDGSWSSWTKAA